MAAVFTRFGGGGFFHHPPVVEMEGSRRWYRTGGSGERGDGTTSATPRKDPPAARELLHNKTAPTFASAYSLKPSFPTHPLTHSLLFFFLYFFSILLIFHHNPFNVTVYGVYMSLFLSYQAFLLLNLFHFVLTFIFFSYLFPLHCTGVYTFFILSIVTFIGKVKVHKQYLQKRNDVHCKPTLLLYVYFFFFILSKLMVYK